MTHDDCVFRRFSFLPPPPTGCFRRTWQASWYSFIEGAKFPAKHRNKVYHGDSSAHTHTHQKKQRRIKIKYMSETFHFMGKVPFFAVAHDGAQQCGQCTQKDLNLHIKTITEKNLFHCVFCVCAPYTRHSSIPYYFNIHFVGITTFVRHSALSHTNNPCAASLPRHFCLVFAAFNHCVRVQFHSLLTLRIMNLLSVGRSAFMLYVRWAFGACVY